MDAPRWDRALPLAGVVVAGALLGLAILAENAFRGRHDLALDGRALRLAHRLEADLRETRPEASAAVLERFVAASDGAIPALAILGVDGAVEVRAGTPTDRHRDVDLFLGPLWHGGGYGPGAGRRGHRAVRTLRLWLSGTALRRPLAERLLLPVAGIAGMSVVALAILGARLLRRERRTAVRAAARRRLEGLGRAGAGLAHQLRTPLATIKGTCQLLEEDLPATAQTAAARTAAERLRRVLAQTERMETLLGHLLDYARPPEPEPAEVDLGALVDALREADPRLQGALRWEGDVAVPRLRVDPDHLRQILENLLANALAESPADAPIELGARRVADGVEITVDDRGAGPGEDPEHLFEPYVTRRADGTGLGLPIARALAEANGGTLGLSARPGGGGRAVLRLPSSGEVP